MHANSPVNRIMSTHVHTVGPDDSISVALRLFMSHALHHLPVVEDRRVIGMLSSADMMKLPFSMQAISLSHESWSDSRWRVKEFMRCPAITVPEHESAQRAAELMAINGIHALPVVDSNDQLAGILTTTDVMHDCLDPLPDPPTEATSAQRFPLSAARVASALASARKAISARRDPYGIGAALLSMHERTAALERVATAAKRYLNGGQDEQLHTLLRREIDRADRLQESLVQPPVVDLADDG